MLDAFMARSVKSLVVGLVVLAAGLACLVGLGVGLWCLLDGAGTQGLLLRGGIALAAVLLATTLLAWIPGLLLERRLAALLEMIANLQAGRSPRARGIVGPAELAELDDGLVQLGQNLEQQHRQRERQQLDAARQQRTAALARLADGVAREVQKPLAGVVGFAEMALRQPGVEGQLRNYLTLIDQEARTGREALERLMRYARDEEPTTEALDVNQLLVDASRALIAPADRERNRLKLNLAEDLPRVAGDASQLMEVLTSLIQNAREAMLPDGGTIELSTNAESNGQAVLMVRDSGRGIPPAEQDQVFTPYYSTKGRQRGAGLSLAIAESIVRRHGGRIDFFSKPGTGSVFFVHLPASSTAAPARAAPPAPSADAAAEAVSVRATAPESDD